MSDLLRRNSQKKQRIVSNPRAAEPPSDVAPPEIKRHSQVLVARYRTIKHITKALTGYFENMVALEAHSSKSLAKMASQLDHIAPLSSAESSDFLPVDQSNSLSNVLISVKAATAQMGESHSQLAKNITIAVVEPLKQVRLNIKAHIKEVENEVGTREEAISKWRDASANAVNEFTSSLAIHKSKTADLTVRSEPYVAARNVKAVLMKQYAEENELQRATAAWQARSKTFEEGVVSQLQAVWASFISYSATSHRQIDTDLARLGKIVEALSPTTEWTALEHSGKLMPSSKPLYDAAKVSFPGQDDEAVKPVKDGVIERKRRFTALYKKEFCVITQSGYLHVFDANDDLVDPKLSLFLPTCMLGPPADALAKKHVFWIGGRRSTDEGTLSHRMKSLKIGASEIEYQYRFTTHADMLEWWEACSQICKASYTTLAGKQQPETPANPTTSDHHKASIESSNVFTDEEEGYVTGDDDDDVESKDPPPPMPVIAETGEIGAEVVEKKPLSDAAGKFSEHL